MSFVMKTQEQSCVPQIDLTAQTPELEIGPYHLEQPELPVDAPQWQPPAAA